MGRVSAPFGVTGWIRVQPFTESLEGLLAYRKVVRRADETAALAVRERPDVAVLIDSWGFTLRVAQRLRRLDPKLPLVKYVAPQVWASRPARAKTAAEAFDLLLTIHAFDAPAFERRHGRNRRAKHKDIDDGRALEQPTLRPRFECLAIDRDVGELRHPSNLFPTAPASSRPKGNGAGREASAATWDHPSTNPATACRSTAVPTRPACARSRASSPGPAPVRGAGP